MKAEMEVMREIWIGHGELIEVGPDRDSLGMVEIRWKDDSGKITSRMSFPLDVAKLASKAIASCADELESKEE